MVEDLFAIEVPDGWSFAWQRDASDDDHVAELKDDDSETYLRLYHYGVPPWNEFRERRPLLEQILESWRRTEGGPRQGRRR